MQMPTRRRGNHCVGLDVYSTCRVVGWELEVADRDTRQSIEGSKGNVFLEVYVIEDSAQGFDLELIGGDRPGEFRIVQEIDREICEPER